MCRKCGEVRLTELVITGTRIERVCAVCGHHELVSGNFGRGVPVAGDPA
jgi:hypothetical protein